MSSAEEVRRRFEWDAKSFDSIYRSGNASHLFDKVLRRAVFERYRIAFEQAGDVRGKRILDIGCGSGIYCAEFAHRGAAEVVGLDFSQPMLDLATAEVAARNTETKCRFILGDFRQVELPSQAFDVSVAMGVFDYLPDPGPFLKKMATVTKGVALASFPTRSGVRGVARRLRYRLTGRGDVYFYSEQRVRDLAQAAGFTRFDLIPIDAPFSGSGVVLAGYGNDGTLTSSPRG